MGLRERVYWSVGGAGVIAANLLAMIIVPATRHHPVVAPDRDQTAVSQVTVATDRA